MLNFVRRHSGSWVVKALLIILGASFIVGFGILTGFDQNNMSGNNQVASVDGSYITNRELQTAYQRLYERYQQKMGDLDPELLKKLNLRFQALNMLVNRMVIAHKARDLGFRASDEEVLDAIKRIPAFRDKNGNFSPQYYKAVLANQQPRIIPTDFEKDQRNGIILRKVQAFVESSILVTEEEALQDYIRKNTTVSARFLVFAPKNFLDKTHVSKAEEEAYYAEHAQEYRSGEQLTFDYLRLSPGKLMPAIKVDEKELSDYFEQHKSEFQTSELEVKVRHILVKVAPQATPAEREKAKKKAEKLLARARGGEDFAELARTSSDDSGSAASGGNLGWFGKGKMVPAFEKVAFATKPGKISDVFETQFGFHFLQTLARKEPGKVGLTQVRGQVEQKVRAQKIEALMATLRKNVDKQIAAGTPLPKIAKTLNIQYEQGHWEANDPSGAKYPKQIIDEVKKLAVGSGAWSNFAGVSFWLHLEEKQTDEPLTFDKVKARIAKKLKIKKSLTVAAESATDTLARLHKGASLDRMAKQLGLEVQTTGALSLDAKTIPGVGDDLKMIKTVLSLTQEHSIARVPIRVDNKYYIFVLVERHDVTMKEFRANAEEYKNQLLSDRREKAWENWIRAIKKDASIKLLNSSVNTTRRS